MTNKETIDKWSKQKAALNNNKNTHDFHFLGYSLSEIDFLQTISTYITFSMFDTTLLSLKYVIDIWINQFKQRNEFPNFVLP